MAQYLASLNSKIGSLTHHFTVFIAGLIANVKFQPFDGEFILGAL
jgi:hypothetical protein